MCQLNVNDIQLLTILIILAGKKPRTKLSQSADRLASRTTPSQQARQQSGPSITSGVTQSRTPAAGGGSLLRLKEEVERLSQFEKEAKQLREVVRKSRQLEDRIAELERNKLNMQSYIQEVEDEKQSLEEQNWQLRRDMNKLVRFLNFLSLIVFLN